MNCSYSMYQIPKLVKPVESSKSLYWWPQIIWFWFQIEIEIKKKISINMGCNYYVIPRRKSLTHHRFFLLPPTSTPFKAGTAGKAVAAGIAEPALSWMSRWPSVFIVEMSLLSVCILPFRQYCDCNWNCCQIGDAEKKKDAGFPRHSPLSFPGAECIDNLDI